MVALSVRSHDQHDDQQTANETRVKRRVVRSVTPMSNETFLAVATVAMEERFEVLRELAK